MIRLNRATFDVCRGIEYLLATVFWIAHQDADSTQLCTQSRDRRVNLMTETTVK